MSPRSFTAIPRCLGDVAGEGVRLQPQPHGGSGGRAADGRRPNADRALRPGRAVRSDTPFVVLHEGIGNVGQNPFNIVLEVRPVSDYDVRVVIVVLDDRSAVHMLGFDAIPDKTLLRRSAVGAAVRGVVPACSRLRLAGELRNAVPSCQSLVCRYAPSLSDSGSRYITKVAT